MTPTPARPFRPRPLDWTKPLRTRDGRKARLLGKLEGNEDPYVVAVLNENGVEEAWTYLPSGDYVDLENAPETRVIELWVNVYRNYCATYQSEETARRFVTDGALVVAHRITAEVEIP